MVTAAHIDRFLIQKRATPPLDAFFRFCHSSPTTVKVIEWATLFFGIGLLFTSLFVSSGTIVLSLTGALLTLASAVSFYALSSLAPTRIDIKIKPFRPGVCEGGELFYRGDLPILKLNGDTPFLAGKAQGYLMAEAIHEIRTRFDTALHTFLKRPRAEQIPNLIAQVKATIPHEYLQEMQGLVEGYNTWASEKRSFHPLAKMTLDELVLSHLMPDAHSLKMGGIVKNPFLQEAVVPACTSLIDRDLQKGIIFARNMDWPSLNLTGKYTFVKHTVKRHRHIVEVSVPGMVGSLTGMNNRGLSLAMNVCPSKESEEIRGMPALFYNRRCLEACDSLPQVAEFVAHNEPLGAYHLSVADSQGGASYHFNQGEVRFHLRNLNNTPLATFNMRIGDPVPHPVDQGYTVLRKKTLEEFYTGVTPDMDRTHLAAAALSLPGINNHKTTHTVLMHPATLQMKVAYDNAFSGDQPLIDVPTREFFGLQQLQPPVTIGA